MKFTVIFLNTHKVMNENVLDAYLKISNETLDLKTQNTGSIDLVIKIFI